MDSAQASEASADHLAYQQALRYAEDLRELYQRERERAEEVEAGRRALELREAELAALHAIDLSILGVAPVEETLGTATGALRRLMPVDRAAVLVYDAGRQQIRELLGWATESGSGSWEDLPEGALREAIRTRTPVTVDLEGSVDPWLAALRRDQMRSGLIVPLVAEARALGVLVILSPRPHAYSDHETGIARRIAAQVAVALRARELADRERRRAAELDAVRVTSEAVGASLDLREVLQAALESCLRLTGLDAGLVSLVDAERRALVLEADKNVPSSVRVLLERIPLGTPLSEMFGGHAQILADPLGDPRFTLASGIRAAGYANLSGMVAPIEWNGERCGMVAVVSFRGRDLSDDDLSLLRALSRPISSAIGNARLHESLRTTKDELRRGNEALRRALDERRQLLSRLTTAQEEERKRIATDIHDDSIQVMTAVGMHLYNFRRALADPEHQGLLDKVEETVTAAIDRLRHLMFELRPAALDREGLSTALRLLLEQNGALGGPQFDLESKLRTEPPPEIRVVVYRIVQEALVNVRKHARASKVHVVLEEAREGILVRIIDDGTGFVASQPGSQAPGHLGLTSMRERAEQARGWWRITSTPGEGTTVEFWIPLPKDNQRRPEMGAA